MPLLLLDLDNTLVDRAAAFRRWAEDFVGVHGAGSEAEIEWLVDADRDGYESRDRLLQLMGERFGLSPLALGQLEQDLRQGMADRLIVDARIPEALRAARDAGWVPFVVTNGAVQQQERKLRVTGLDAEVAGWVISEAAGVMKPDPRIFQAAAEVAGWSLSDAWMIGDSAEADIQGAYLLGLPSIWVDRGRTWQHASFAPTLVASDCSDAIHLLLGMSRSKTGPPNGISRA
ncbi:HAD family hydrolase [Psychromicrobium xiongbiense]|uniref:HAD family hydrolase n=1 Tax=Psychromicrobium xiongbiense TaxID=3051184 RepID=UPI002553CF1E|nr:HAD family hydrolase [Psychromicrobium sp. YIM S02556]